MPLPPLTPAALLIPRPAVARNLAVVAGLLLAAALAACSSSGTPSAGGSRTAGSGSSSAPSSAAAAPSSGSASPARGGTGTAATGKVISGLITFTGTLQLTGATTQRSPFTAFPGVTSPASSCGRLAARGTPVPAGRKPGFGIPAPPAGSPVYFVAEVSPYHGPGTYGKTSILAAGASLVVGSAAYNPLAATASASVTFRADGSGTFTFRNAAPSTSGSRTLSGSLSWTCSG